MHSPQPDETALRALRANRSPRYCAIDCLERYASGTQYDDRPSFWSDERPLFERAPCIVVPVARTAANSFVDLVLGEGRFPKLTTHTGEDDAAFDERFGLSDDDSETLDRFIANVASDKQSKLATVARRMLYQAQTARTAVAIACVRSGKLTIETTRAKWCVPTFDPTEPERVVKLEIRYPYLETFKDPRTGKSDVRTMLYRRVIDATRDVTYKPAKASENGVEPDEWLEDKQKTHEHGFGFCPVVWYKFLPEEDTVAEIDGAAIHERLLDEIDALNFAYSMRHRAALMSGDPQVVEIGVDAEHNPAPMGEMARIIMPNAPGTPGGWAVPGAGGKPARRKGPGSVWRYPDPLSKVQLLALDAGALKPIEENADDIMALIAEALAWVPIDPKDMSLGASLSGRAIEWLHKKQIDRCNSIRDDFGQNCLMRLVDMLLRICLRMPPERMRVPGIAKALPILERFDTDVVLDDGATIREWISPDISLVWGDYFTTTETDQKLVGDNVRADLVAGIITKRTALEKLARFYNIGDVAQYLEALEKEAKERAEGLHGAVEALKKAGVEDEKDEDDDEEDDGPVKPAGTEAEV